MTGVAFGLALVVAALAFRATGAGGSKVSVSFVNSEHSFGEGPVTVECERLAFAVRNLGARSVLIDVPEIVDESWTQSQLARVLGPVKAHQTTQLYLYLPKGSRPRSLRVRVNQEGSVPQKIRFALRLLFEKARGGYLGKQLWFGHLQVPVAEFTISPNLATMPASGGN